MVAGVCSGALANEDVLKLQADPANNVMPSITYNGWNFSQLDQITLDNVNKLRVDWTFQIGVADEAQAPPLVVGDTMYIATPKPNRIYALDLSDAGAIKWEFRADSSNLSEVTPLACCGAQTRGINYAEGKLWIAILAGHATRCALSMIRFKQGKWRGIAVDIEPKAKGV